MLELLRGANQDSLEDARRTLIESGSVAEATKEGLGFLCEAESHLGHLIETPGGEALTRVIEHIRQLFREVTGSP